MGRCGLVFFYFIDPLGEHGVCMIIIIIILYGGGGNPIMGFYYSASGERVWGSKVLVADWISGFWAFSLC